jgi:nucleoside-diphosphate-sugar epimerase
MRVLVTGHLGYIGTVLVPRLQAQGHEVFGLDSDLYRRCTFGAFTYPDIPEIQKDVRDIVQEDIDGVAPEAVIHLAGLSNDPLGDLDPELTFEINLHATIRLARMAKRSGTRRFVFSSSCSTYGAGSDDFVDETTPLQPVTPYGESKVLAESALSKMASDNFSPVYMRNATAYGFSPRLRFDLVLNNLVAWAYTTGKVRLKSDGLPWRPLVSIEDIADAAIAALEVPRVRIHDRAINIGATRENYQIREIAEVVSRVVPDCEVSMAPDAAADVRCYRVNCDLAGELLSGFTPRWTIEQGAQQLLWHYRQHGVTLEEFEGPRYQRIAHVRQLMAEGLVDSSLRPTRISTAA